MSPSQASETCASASSATSAGVNSLCEWAQTVSRKHDVSASDALTIVDHASPNSSSAITQEVVLRCAISPVTQYQIIIVEMTIAAHAQDITNPIASWSATVPTPAAGVVAVSELCAFPVVMRQPRRAIRPTYISDIASPLTAAATLPQCSCRDGHRQQ